MHIATSGQPTRDQLKLITDAGYEAVINLSVPTSQLLYPDEGHVVISNDMTYMHLPINWNNPSFDHYKSFEAIMNSLVEKKVWVHCVSNVVAAFFVYTYLINRSDNQDNFNVIDNFELPVPNVIWAKFIMHNVNY